MNKGERSLVRFTEGRLAVLLIIFSPANLPIVRLHGFCAIGVVLLGEEVLLVGGDLHEVGFAGLDHAGYHHELRAVLELTLTQRRGAFHRGTQVNAVTVFGGRCSGSVGREQHLLAAVLTALTGFGQCAGHMINSGRISYRCHSCELWLRTIRDYVAQWIFRHALTLRSANTALVYVPRGEPSKLEERV